MRVVPVIVDNCLRVDGNLIGHDLAEAIFDELTIHNRAKDIARKMERWGWQDMPDEFQLGDLDGDTVVMPRGYAYQLKTLLREEGIKVRWIDRRKWQRRAPKLGNGAFPYRPHQREAVRQIIRNQQGMYEAPTGSGKTVTCIGFLTEKSPLRTLVLVDKLDLLHQWRAEISRWLDMPIEQIGQIGDGKWINEPGMRITVATVQTIWNAMKDDVFTRSYPWFFLQWDCVIVDECHHVTAQTIREIVGRFWAKYRFGVSATPDRKDDKFEFALNVLGEVFWQDDEDNLRSSGVLVRPSVQVVRTAFYHPYWSDHHSDDDDECEVPDCRLSGKRPHFHSNNYGALKKALVGDEDRNALVMETVVRESLKGNHHHLIVSDEVRHLEALRDVLETEYGHTREFAAALPPVFVMTGRVKGEKRAQIKAEIINSPAAIVFATVAKEGLDIPAIDRIYLPFPTRSAPKVQQWIGRGTRTSEGKSGTLIYDFFDVNCGVLKQQFRNRRFQCYDKLDIEVRLEA